MKKVITVMLVVLMSALSTVTAFAQGDGYDLLLKAQENMTKAGSYKSNGDVRMTIGMSASGADFSIAIEMLQKTIVSNKKMYTETSPKLLSTEKSIRDTTSKTYFDGESMYTSGADGVWQKMDMELLNKFTDPTNGGSIFDNQFMFSDSYKSLFTDHVTILPSEVIDNVQYTKVQLEMDSDTFKAYLKEYIDNSNMADKTPSSVDPESEDKYDKIINDMAMSIKGLYFIDTKEMLIRRAELSFDMSTDIKSEDASLSMTSKVKLVTKISDIGKPVQFPVIVLNPSEA